MNSPSISRPRLMFCRCFPLLLVSFLSPACGGSSTEAEAAQEDTEWERDWSSGEVGCSPDEISVTEMSGWGRNKTWTAECQGQIFHCTSRAAEHDHDVSCKAAEGLGGSPAPAVTRREAPSWATSELPQSALGYTFGEGLLPTAQTCTDANNSWTQEAKQFRCSGLPVDVGLPGQSTAAFCSGQLCVVTGYLMLSESKDAERTFKIITRDLAKKYGAPTKKRRIKEPVCDESFIECVEQAKASWQALWKWETGELLRVKTMVKNKKAILAIRYQLSEPDPTKKKAPAVNTSAF